ncbi:MAG: hypothetical protein V3R77_08640 [Candidatus Binatia bacterium]
MLRLAAISGLVLLSGGLIGWTDHALADDAVVLDSSVVQISAVLASRDGRGIDPRLKHLRPQLRGFPFRSYQLLAVQSCEFATGDQCSMDIPGGGYLQMNTTESTPGHFKMRLLLIQDNRPVLNADVKLSRNASLLLKSNRTEAGTIIVSIRAPAQPSIENFETLSQGGE